MPTQPQNPSLLEVAGDIRAPQFAFRPAATWDDIMRDLRLMPQPQPAGATLQTRQVGTAAGSGGLLDLVRRYQNWIIGGSAALILLSLTKK